MNLNEVVDLQISNWDLHNYLNDNLDSLIPTVNLSSYQYSTIDFVLQQKSIVQYLRLYDGVNQFADKPAFIYAVNNTDTIYLGTFTGDYTNSYVQLNLPYAVVATKICVKKYGNNLPQKVQVWGSAYQNGLEVDANPSRILIDQITPTINTGMNFQPWLNDNLNNLVSSVWNGSNMQYVDVKLQLHHRTRVSKISLYDEAGTFTSNPCYVFTKKDTAVKLIGIFQGLQYKQFVPYIIGEGLQADEIIIRKYGNNIPQKVQVFGRCIPNDPGLPFVVPTLPDANDRLSFTTLQSDTSAQNQFQPWLQSSLDSLVFMSSTQNWHDLKLTLPHSFKIRQMILYALDSNISSTPALINLQKDTSIQTTIAYQGGLYNKLIQYSFTEQPIINQVSVRQYGNVFPQKIILYGNTDTLPLVKIPIAANRWMSTTHAPNGVAALFNGLTAESINTGFANWKPNYQFIYPVEDYEQINLKKIKLYDYTGSFSSEPAIFSATTKSGKVIPLGSFNGGKYMEWVGPYPERNLSGEQAFLLDSTVNDIQYITIYCTRNNLPTEIEFYGNYSVTDAPLPATPIAASFNGAVGMNGFEWDFVNPTINSRKIDEVKYGAIANFKGFRQYLDWKRIENTKGWYTFSPAHNGGWDLDMTYARCKRDSIEVLVCMKDIPDWMKATYPTGEQFADNIPLEYGAARDSVQSYVAKAKAAFQFAARYGRNNQIPDSLLRVNTAPRWTNDPPNTIKKGLDYVQYIECGNELDKWWKDQRGYMNSFEYAALLSAFYDGHKGTLGPGVGVKNADSTMKVVMTGLASGNVNYVRGMVEWCRINRGYLPSGQINLCWDVINYHHYSNDAANSQLTTSTRGAAPELGNVESVANNFSKFSNQYCGGMPVWVSELGFDLNQQSPMKAIPIGNRTALQTQADWTLRSALLNWRQGISRLFYYELNDFNLNSSVKYASMGLCDSLYQRRPALDYLTQVNRLMGNYHFVQNLQHQAEVDLYENGAQKIYAVWMPTEQGAQQLTVLNFNQVDSVIINLPVEGSMLMNTYTRAVYNDTIQLLATETPVFVQPKPRVISQARVQRPQNIAVKDAVLVYPNPFDQQINFRFQSENATNYRIELFNTTGVKLATVAFGNVKGGQTKTITYRAGNLRKGIYVYHLMLGDSVQVGKLVH
jgi:hypothetical protein